MDQKNPPRHVHPRPPIQHLAHGPGIHHQILPREVIISFGVRWLDTAFHFERQNANNALRTSEDQSHVKPPHSKGFSPFPSLRPLHRFLPSPQHFIPFRSRHRRLEPLIHSPYRAQFLFVLPHTHRKPRQTSRSQRRRLRRLRPHHRAPKQICLHLHE